MPSTPQKRISYLDSLRGIAILLVILYHAYSRWSNVLLFTKVSQNIVIFKNGWLGVQLFFLISGYVILMTLEKSTSLFNFMKKRLLRLYPALLIVSVLLFISAPLFKFRPSGKPHFIDFIPSIFFIEPLWFYKLFNFKISMIENTFWSLFVEVRFYLILSFVYFYINKSKAIWYIFALFTLSIFLTFISLSVNSSVIRNIHLALDIIGFQHYGWFASGALLYQFHECKNLKILWLSIFAGISNILFMSFVQFKSINIFIMALIIFATFISSGLLKTIQTIISNRFFLFIGTLSYPLYLIHENMMVSLILQLKSYFPEKYLITLPLIILSFIIILSYIFTLFIDPWVNKITKSKIEFIPPNTNFSERTRKV